MRWDRMQQQQPPGALGLPGITRHARLVMLSGPSGNWGAKQQQQQSASRTQRVRCNNKGRTYGGSYGDAAALPRARQPDVLVEVDCGCADHLAEKLPDQTSTLLMHYAGASGTSRTTSSSSLSCWPVPHLHSSALRLWLKPQRTLRQLRTCTSPERGQGHAVFI